MRAMNPQSALARPDLEDRVAALRPGLDLLGLPACVLDARQRYHYVNAACCAHFGKREAEFLGRTPDEVFEFKPQDARRAQLQRAFNGETVIFNRLTLEGPRAGQWVRAHYFPLRDEAGGVEGVLVVLWTCRR